ncbi:aquaporin-9-like [Macrobrachium rosenbergii]|uniref:aquaporin-9-like n=1 Tax=Macrobrachium rosenbergii TaxID=79674 RepID=UPI0034D4E4C6
MEYNLRSKLKIKNVLVRDFLAEFLGTFVLILFGNASVAQMVLTNKVGGDVFAVNWAWGIAVMLAILTSGGVSGGHINPAVTLAFAIWDKLPWIKVPVYLLGQYAGAFFASCLVYVIYFDALHHYEPSRSLATAGIWATYPGSMTNNNGTVVSGFLSFANGFGDQVLATAALLVCVCAIIDARNMEVPKHLIPLSVGLLVFNMGNCFGFNCGCALNPARDLAPRFFTLIAGWGDDPFTASTREGIPWWWVPIVAPHIGAILGVGIYVLFIEMHHPDLEDQSESKVISLEDLNHKGTSTKNVIRVNVTEAPEKLNC